MQVTDLGQIANLNGASFRSHNNSVMQAQASKHSGTTEPPIVYPNMEWADTGTGLLKVRDTANTRWWTLGRLGMSDTPPEAYSKGGQILSDAEFTRINSFRTVTEFGAKGDAVTDNRSAFAAAVAAMPADGTGALVFPAGRYIVSDATILNKPGRYIGAGKECCQIITTHPSATIFEAGAGTRISGFTLVSAVTRAGGFFIDISSTSYGVSIIDIDMVYGYHGIRIRNGVSIVNIYGIGIREFIKVYGIGIQIEGGFDVSIHDIVIDNSNNIRAGIRITNVGDVEIYDANIMRSGFCILLEPPSGSTVASVFATHCFFDTSDFGLYATTVPGSAIARCSFNQCWFSSHTQHGAFIETGSGGVIDGIDFLAPHVFGNTYDGIHASGAWTKGVDINAAKIAGNGAAGVSFVNSSSSFSVMNSRVGATCLFPANRYGVFVDTGCTNYRIIGNDVSGNTISNIIDGGVNPKVVALNLGA